MLSNNMDILCHHIWHHKYFFLFTHLVHTSIFPFLWVFKSFCFHFKKPFWFSLSYKGSVKLVNIVNMLPMIPFGEAWINMYIYIFLYLYVPSSEFQRLTSSDHMQPHLRAFCQWVTSYLDWLAHNMTLLNQLHNTEYLRIKFQLAFLMHRSKEHVLGQECTQKTMSSSFPLPIKRF